MRVGRKREGCESGEREREWCEWGERGVSGERERSVS